MLLIECPYCGVRAETEFAALAAKDMAANLSEIAHFPLARIEAAGDHARIETLELTAQYAPAVATAPTR
jgi:sarcosine oxidase delta subunit